MLGQAEPQRRTALITGGSSGLGLACATALLRSSVHRWQVYLLGRDRASGERTVAELLQQAPPGSARFLAADLGSFAAVRAVAETLQQAHVRLDALVCNAGVQLGARNAMSAQGLEATFAVNHLGHFLLVQSLAPLFNANARIVIVTSSTHDPAERTGMPAPRWVEPKYLARPHLDPLRQFEAADPVALINRRRYTTSKLCNLYFAYALARRVSAGELSIPPGVTVNAFDPGLMPGTALGRDFPQPQRFVWRYVLPTLRPLLKRAVGNVHTASESGKALAELLEAPRWQGIHGKYLQGLAEARSSAESYDATRAEALWAESVQLIGAGAPD